MTEVPRLRKDYQAAYYRRNKERIDARKRKRYEENLAKERQRNRDAYQRRKIQKEAGE
jgi:hypothetical protein